MSLESFNFIDSLNVANPTTTDNVSEGDDHIRGIKTTIKNTFPNINAAVTATDEELNFVDGVTSAVQTQLDAKIIKTLATGSAVLPAGTTAQRDGTPAAGYLRWNTTDTSAEVYDGTAWAAVGGGNTTDQGLHEHANTISANYVMTAGNNALTAGPITINTGVSVSIPTGSTWVVA